MNICSTTSTSSPIGSNKLPSECSNYSIIIDEIRRVTYKGNGSCDQYLFTSSPTWVRFCGLSGTMLGNYSVNPYYCNANSPG
jgi:hypothetical protein